jgi:hypothetical protein
MAGASEREPERHLLHEEWNPPTEEEEEGPGPARRGSRGWGLKKERMSQKERRGALQEGKARVELGLLHGPTRNYRTLWFHISD